VAKDSHLFQNSTFTAYLEGLAVARRLSLDGEHHPRRLDVGDAAIILDALSHMRPIALMP
jgi:hypothetical protein